MKAGRRRHKHKRQNQGVISNIAPVNNQATPGVPESTYLAFVRTFKSWAKGTPAEDFDLEIPSFDFGSSFDTAHPSCLQEVRDAESQPIRNYLFGITNLPANRAYVFQFDGCNAILITHGSDVLTSEIDVGFAIPATAFVQLEDDSWSAFSCPWQIYIIVILAEYLMQNRKIDYLPSGGTHLQRLNKARLKRGKKTFPEPKTIYLHKTVRTAATSLGNSRALSHEFQVTPFKRRYKRPILNGPNKGKMVIEVSGHRRGIGLPPKPQSAETMQYRVLP